MELTLESARLRAKEHVIRNALQELGRHGYEITEDVRIIEGSRSMRRTAAIASVQTHRNPNGDDEIADLWITISPLYLGQASDTDISDTMKHEFTHIWFYQMGELKECHGRKFLSIADQVGFHRTCNQFVDFRYVVFCPGCGETWGRHRMCKLVRLPHIYYCPNCDLPLQMRNG